MKRPIFEQHNGLDQGAGGAAEFSAFAVAGDAYAPVEFPSLAGFPLFEYDDEDEPAFRAKGFGYHVYRRALDICASSVGLLFLGALLPILAVLIKLDSRGPVFYRQERVGINRRRGGDGAGPGERRKVSMPGRPIEIIKLRTMTTDAEKNGPQWASRNDARVTRLGKYLRKTRLDELPQFWNVLRGDMSLIGPRPERLVFVRQFGAEVPHYYERLLVKPGLTGLAQVRNGYDTDAFSVHRKVAYDRESIRKAGLRMDLRILWETISVVIKGDGAH